jgi:hypothetical protein
MWFCKNLPTVKKKISATLNQRLHMGELCCIFTLNLTDRDVTFSTQGVFKTTAIS